MKVSGKNQDDQRVEIVISNRTVTRVLVMVVLLILGLGLLREAGYALLLIFISFFLALALNAPVHWIAEHLPGKRRGSRVMATTISYLVVVGFLVTFLSLLVPPAVTQTTNFLANAPEIIDDLRDQDGPVGTFIRDNNLESAVASLSDELSELARGAGGAAITTVGAVGASVVSLLIVLAMTFMMLVEGPRWVRLAQKLVPERRRVYVSRLTRDMYGVVKGFVNGQVAIAALAAIVILPVMLVLQIPYAGALVVVVFIAGLIPMIGHFIGATLVTIMALFNSVVSAVLILSFYILYQQIENYVIQPRIQATTTKISPLLVFIAVVVGASLGGLVGGLVAIPVMACLRILILDYLQHSGRLNKPGLAQPKKTKSRSSTTGTR